MKKEKLSSKRKSDNVVKPVVEYGLQRVKDWAQKELTELQKTSKAPIVIELANGDYTVATFKVEKVSPVCWRVGTLEFMDKRSAIFYCALSHLSKFSEARELCAIDAIVGKLDLDKAMFRVKLDRAHETNDQFKIDLFSSRYEDVKIRLIRARQDLEKLMQQYKYIQGLGK